MRSDSTRVPPVTPERSPPASRTTGADSPVIADSSTEATPSTISPSPGIDLAGVDHDQVASRRAVETSGRQTVSVESVAGRVERQAEGGRLLAGLAQGVGLGLAAGLGQRRGEVGEQHRQEQPDVQRDQVAERGQRRGRVDRPWTTV